MEVSAIELLTHETMQERDPWAIQSSVPIKEKPWEWYHVLRRPAEESPHRDIGNVEGTPPA